MTIIDFFFFYMFDISTQFITKSNFLLRSILFVLFKFFIFPSKYFTFDNFLSFEGLEIDKLVILCFNFLSLFEIK